MALEIERKYLVNPDLFLPLTASLPARQLTQGYISRAKQAVVRVRIADDQAMLTLKGATEGLTRQEFEYAIPLDDAKQVLQSLCNNQFIEKTRYLYQQSELLWEVDVFHGKHQGLILAEVELHSEEQVIELPEWVLEEVSHDSRYYNANLLNF